jgi:3'-phosphoadenosine 5'-phosphosulfate sulfotransferase
MVTNEESIRAEFMPLEVVWRNPLDPVREDLRVKELSDSYYQWAEQARKIRARRANWDANHSWAA